MSPLLHEQNLARIPFFGGWLRRQLVKRINETRGAATGKDPDISVVIRSKNNAKQLKVLLEDIRQQDYAGNVEVIVVDTESTDGSVAVARKFGAKIVPIKQSEFSYPRALNAGFEVATKSWVFSIVDHSSLSSKYILKAATRWDDEPKVAAIWSFSLPNANATLWEEFGYMATMWRRIARAAHIVRGKEARTPGLLAANDLLVRRAAWEQAGGFDERYGAGGEDSALGRALLALDYKLVYDPGISVYHTHGLGLIANLRQIRYWQRLAKPLAFDLTALKKYRADL